MERSLRLILRWRHAARSKVVGGGVAVAFVPRWRHVDVMLTPVSGVALMPVSDDVVSTPILPPVCDVAAASRSIPWWSFPVLVDAWLVTTAIEWGMRIQLKGGLGKGAFSYVMGKSDAA